MPVNELEILLGEIEGKRPSKANLSFISTKPFKTRLGNKNLRLFSSSLARLLQGGVSLLRALEITGREFSKGSFQAILSGIKESIQQGQSLSGALRSSSSFPLYFVQMVEAGELSGTLDKVLESLSEHLEKEEERRRKIKEALAYPVLVLSLGLVTFGVLLKVVLPKIAQVYEDLGGELPGITKGILLLSHAFLPVALGGILVVGLLFFALKRSKDSLFPYLLKLPFLGKFLRKTKLMQFSSLLSLMLQSGIPILQAVESTGKTFGRGGEKDFLQIRESLSQGKSLSQTLEGIPWTEESALALILSGEESGKLPEALSQISKEAQKEIESQAHLLLKLLEPSLILGIGLLVGFVVVSAILPILEMNTLVR